MADATVRQLRIMISSTREDLRQYRDEASKIIREVAKEKQKKAQLTEVSMEEETQTGDRECAVAVSKGWVEQSDWIVLIVGWNYGTISDEEGANGLSVTEWEYRHAVEKRKKIFVFIAGEWKTANAYRALQDEVCDLKDFMRQNEEQEKKLALFKEDLAKTFVEYFKNLAHFRERLEKTLRDAVDDLPIVVQPGSNLANLIIAVTPALENCIVQVNRLADSKKIHDCLHDLRHKVIRRLWDEVLPSWSVDGRLNERKAGFIANRSTEAQRLLGRIQAVQDSTAVGNSELKTQIEDLLNLPPFWDAENAWPSREQFTESISECATAVQSAFTAADNAMRVEERALSVLHTILLEKIGEAPERWYLDPDEKQTLKDELDKIAITENRLTYVMNIHHDWQSKHDRLEQLDSLRETVLFDKRLRTLMQVERKPMLQLVKNQLDPNVVGFSGQKRSSQGVSGRGVTANALPRFAEENEQLKSDLQCLYDSLEPEDKRIDEQAYDSIRKLFDEVFYQIDKFTRTEVERAQQRVIGVQEMLRRLHGAGTRQSHTQAESMLTS